MTILRVGSQGDDVRALQGVLGIKADGVFGKETEAAVETFQKAHSLFVDGEVGPLTLAAMGIVKPPVAAPAQSAGPSWLTEATKDLGFHETGDNRGIEKLIASARCGELGQPWCAIATNAWLERAGIHGTRSPSSQSFRRDANFVNLDGPALGAIAVYWRGSGPNSGQGHVGLYIGETATQVLTLGGNESDAVRKQFEPKSRLFGFWWPKSVPLPSIAPIKVKDSAGHPVGSVT